jgi:ethanolamine utilization protein EutQ (cupin superfamily)
MAVDIVRAMVLDDAVVTRFEPARVEHVTAAASGLEHLGAVFMTFDGDGDTEPWTLQYEEVIYVVSGQVKVTVVGDGVAETVRTGATGDVLTLHQGATVRYAGTPGTRLFVALVPIKWRELAQ